MDKLLKQAMIEAEVKNAKQLFQLGNGAFTYQSACNALNGKDVKLTNLVAMFNAMGFELTYRWQEN